MNLYRFIASASLVLLFEASATAANLVVVWNELALRAIAYANPPPPVAVRQLALVHLAMHDALQGVEHRYEGYWVTTNAPVPCSPEAAASAAAYQCLRTLFPKSAETLDSHQRAIEAAIPETPAKAHGLSWGKSVAMELLRQRVDDGAGQTVAYERLTRPGYWQRTPQNFDPPLLPNWGRTKPFGIPSAEAFRTAPPPALDSAEWARQYDLVKVIGATNSATRTLAQREIALFWADGPGTSTPPGHWNRIAQQVIVKKAFDLGDSARLLALLNVALADAGIVCWETKYRYNWWRPITAIRAGDTDSNPDTAPDPNWKPLIPTPPFPEHTSGHSTFSGAGAAVLVAVTGSDELPFVTRSDGLPGVVRHFRRFSEAAQEAGMSRIYGGIHFPSANEQGLESGRQVGEYVAQHLLLLRTTSPKKRPSQ